MVIDGCVWEWFSSTFENIWEHQTGVLLFFFLRKETITGCNVIAAFTQLWKKPKPSASLIRYAVTWPDDLI